MRGQGGTPLRRPQVRCAWCGDRLKGGRRLVPVGQIVTCSDECWDAWAANSTCDVTEADIDRCLDRLAAEIPPSGEMVRKVGFVQPR